jgi:hypothetical protein
MARLEDIQMYKNKTYLHCMEDHLITQQQTNNNFLLSPTFYLHLIISFQHSLRQPSNHTPIFNMKASMIIASAAALFSSALAAPAIARDAPLVFTVQLANDQSGKNANADVIVNNAAVTFGQLFGGAFGPQVWATSLQAVSPGAGGNNVQCVVKDPNYPGQAIALNAWNTFIDLDGNVNVATPTDVTYFTIECQL